MCETSVKVQVRSRPVLPRGSFRTAGLQLKRPDPQPGLAHEEEKDDSNSCSSLNGTLKAGRPVALTSADVDQRCRGSHEGQLSVADQARGFRGQVERQHHKVRLFQQVIQALTVPRTDRLLILNAPKKQGNNY